MTTPAHNPDAGQPRPVPQLDTNFRSHSEFGAFCENGRRLFRDCSQSLDLAARAIHGRLRRVGPGDSAEQRRRARRIARHLTLASIAAHAVARLIVRAWAVFEAEFGELQPRAADQGRRDFDLNR